MKEIKLASSRRVGAESSATRTVILDATERLMLEEGYAAVSTRSVAGRAGLKAPLVHYYFPTTDDMLLAVYRRSADQNLERLSGALASDQPLRALWSLSTDQTRTALAVEFMAMANHRKLIGAEIARYVERFRAMQAEMLVRVLGDGVVDARAGDLKRCPPAGLSMLLAGVSRALIMEASLGISAGHAEAIAFVEGWLRSVETGV